MHVFIPGLGMFLLDYIGFIYNRPNFLQKILESMENVLNSFVRDQIVTKAVRTQGVKMTESRESHG